MSKAQFWIILLIFVALFTVITIIAGKSIRIPLWKRMILWVCACVSGYFGGRLMAWIESGATSGYSFFGAHFFGPLGMLLAAYILRISADNKERFSDIIASCLSGCVFIMKINCCLAGCCFGRVLWTTASGASVRFPSQIAESALALALMIYLLIAFRSGKYRGTLMWRYYIIYGVIRFIMNLLRETTPFVGILPAGNFWSLISIALGFFFLYVHKLRMQERQSKKRILHSHSGRR